MCRRSRAAKSELGARRRNHCGEPILRFDFIGGCANDCEVLREASKADPILACGLGEEILESPDGLSGIIQAGEVNRSRNVILRWRINGRLRMLTKAVSKTRTAMNRLEGDRGQERTRI